MLKAVIRNGEHSTLVLGLSVENLRRLQNDEPICFEGGEVGLDNWRVYIVGGEDEARLAAWLKAKGATL